ncbi:hypothetical protein [Sandaracinus amylolyticus]|uniref:hypothetical protein n=1 Tax=Sandaracinus amylolyticus TaxID=927083 RepID=UPI001F42E092|nr:hypothetical protein [Sandaracinus amylolyticus]UJR85787.1 Hypothetical protein I5071_78670 [Sandaracinus amylolyticus]
MDATDESSETPKRSKRAVKAETTSAEASLATPVETTETETPAAEAAPTESEPMAEAAPSDAEAAPTDEAASTETPAAESASSPGTVAAEPISDRRRLQAELDALEKKQAELRRAITIADHPELADAVRVVEGRVYAVTRAEAKMAQGLSKGEERRRETLEKKLAAARAKRDEIDGQIAELERELAPLGEERMRAFEQERRGALEALVSVLGTHDAAFAAAGIDIAALVPDLARWTPELRTVAEEIVARGKS